MVGPLAGRRVIVLAATPSRIHTDRRQLGCSPRDVITARLGGRRKNTEPLNAFGFRHCPFQGAHSTHRPANNQGPLVDTERVSNANLGLDLVTHRYLRELGTPRHAIGSDCRGTGRSLASAEHVRCNNEPLIRVNRQARPNNALPPARADVAGLNPANNMRISRKSVLNENRIRAIRVELPPRLIRDNNIGQHDPRLQGEVTYVKELTPSYIVTLTPRSRRRNRLAVRCRRRRTQRRNLSGALRRCRT